MWTIDEMMVANDRLMRPPRRSPYAAPMPLYGTWTIFVPVASSNSTVLMWIGLPMPEEA